MRDQITMIHAAVLQNMAAVLTWTFTLLSQNDQRYEEIRSEVADVMENRVPTIGDAPRLTRCANAVKEAQRLYPLVWQIFRQANRDTEIDGYKIRRGTQMMFSEWVLQRDARFFPEPEKFQPRRRESPKPEWEFAFFPFGAGPRACLGRELCFLASALILGVFTQRFRLRRENRGGSSLRAAAMQAGDDESRELGDHLAAPDYKPAFYPSSEGQQLDGLSCSR